MNASRLTDRVLNSWLPRAVLAQAELGLGLALNLVRVIGVLKSYFCRCTVQHGLLTILNHVMVTHHQGTGLFLSRLKTLVPIEAAVGSQLGQVFLVFQAASVFNQIVTDKAAVDGRRAQAVAQVTLDHLWACEHEPQVDLLKIDVEGAELKVLLGAEQLLRQLEPIVMFENRQGIKISGAESVKFLATLGYQFYSYEQEWARLKQVEPMTHRLNSLNLIAVPATRRQSLPFEIVRLS